MRETATQNPAYLQNAMVDYQYDGRIIIRKSENFDISRFVMVMGVGR